MGDVEIRRVGPDDAALFGRIADEVFDEAIDPRRLAAYLADPSHMMLLAMEDDLVVGMAMTLIHRHPDKPDELYIDELGVAETHRNRGLGRRLMDAAVQWGKERGCEEAWVGTEPDNAAANAVYRRYGAADPCLIYMWDIG